MRSSLFRSSRHLFFSRRNRKYVARDCALSRKILLSLLGILFTVQSSPIAFTGAKCEANTFDGERCLYGSLTNSIRNMIRDYKQVTASTMRRDAYIEFLRKSVLWLLCAFLLTAWCPVVAINTRCVTSFLKIILDFCWTFYFHNT